MNDKLVVELKSVEEFSENHAAQVLTYLKLGGYKLGLLLNFREKVLKMESSVLLMVYKYSCTLRPFPFMLT